MLRIRFLQDRKDKIIHLIIISKVGFNDLFQFGIDLYIEVLVFGFLSQVTDSF